MEKLLFAQFHKIDEAKREVWGLATEEQVDSSGELMDYLASKPYFEEWSENAYKISGGKSFGNVREMHSLNAVGKLIHIEYDDDNKRISVGAKIVDDDAWQKTIEGVFCGFSIGGQYISREKVGKYVKFVAKPVELSIVDLPCLPSAIFDSIKSQSVQLFKSDGSIESLRFRMQEDIIMDKQLIDSLNTKLDSVLDLVKGDAKTKRVAGEDLGPSAFAYVGDASDTSSWKLPIKFSSDEKSKRHIRNALARFNQTKGIPEGEKAKVKAKIVAAAKKHGIEVSEEAEKAVKLDGIVSDAISKAAEKVFGKSLYNIQDLTSVLQTLRYVLMDAEWESMYEFGGDGDSRDESIAVEIRAAMEHLIEILKDVVEEETSELLTGKAVGKGTGIMADLLEKKKSSLSAHFKKASTHCKGMAECYSKMAGKHTEKASYHSTCMGKADDDMMAAHKANHGFHKGMAADCEKAAKAMVTHAEHMGKMADDMEEAMKVETVEVKKADGATASSEPQYVTVEVMTKAISEAVEKALGKKEEVVAVKAETVSAGVVGISGAPLVDMAKTIGDAVTAAMKPITDQLQALNPEAIQKIVDAAVVKKADEVAEKTIVPTNIHLIPRVNGEDKDYQKVTSDDDIGL